MPGCAAYTSSRSARSMSAQRRCRASICSSGVSGFGGMGLLGVGLVSAGLRALHGFDAPPRQSPGESLAPPLCVPLEGVAKLSAQTIGGCSAPHQ